MSLSFSFYGQYSCPFRFGMCDFSSIVSLLFVLPGSGGTDLSVQNTELLIQP